MLIALFERAVGLYASLIHINAYHQPGVEAGKKAAASVLSLQRQAVAYLAANPGKAYSADALAAAIGPVDTAEMVFKICAHLAANRRGVQIASGAGIRSTFRAL
jgi:glucose-6-phosphate isomerase